MFGTKLKMKRYDRIEQNLIESIEIDFTKPMQIIIGSNGSGKSSIKERLSPLPPPSIDFNKGGYHEYHCTHKGKKWIAITDFGAKGGCYLECDGEVLNNWGTASVQKAIIEREFGLTPQIFNIICGADRFTDMNPTQRRDAIMMLSQLDINPLMRVFFDAKTKQRDAKGYLAKITERLRIEEKNLIDESILAEDQTSLERLRDEFNHYSQFSTVVKEVDKNPLNDKGILLERMDECQKLIPKIPHAFIVNNQVRSRQDLDRFITSTLSAIEVKEKQYDDLMVKLREINKVAEAKATLTNNGIQEIEEQIADIENQITACEDKLSEFEYCIADPKRAKLDFLRLHMELREQLFNLPDNEDLHFNSKRLDESRQLDEGLLFRLSQTKETLYQKEHDLKHVRGAEDVSCPDCHSVFKLGVHPTDEARLVKEIENLNDQIAKLAKEIAENKEYVDDCTQYVEAVKSIYRTFSLTPSNEPFWSALKKTEFYKGGCFEAIQKMDEHVNIYLPEEIKKVELAELLSSKNDILIKAKEALKLIEESPENAVIDQDIYNLRVEIDLLISKVNEAKRYQTRFNEVDLLLEDIDKLFYNFNNAYVGTLDNARAEFVQKTKFDIMKEINIIEQRLDQAKTKEAIFKDVEASLEDAKKQFEEYTLIVNEISPNTGVIADLMNSSISSFVENLNDVIGSVWTSEFKVLPCRNKKDDLDWKFPVKVEGGKVRQDVSKTSTSQKDIINLAFQLIMLQHLGVGDYPLLVDELGSSMDDQHRINMMEVVNSLIETNQCSQVFMISHFAALHEQFANAETFVVDAKNILHLPSVYNKHVKINHFKGTS